MNLVLPHKDMVSAVDTGKSKPTEVDPTDTFIKYKTRFNKLTRREIEIIEALKTHAKNIDIANALHICEKTVKFHFTNIFKKLGVRNRIGVYQKLTQAGL